MKESRRALPLIQQTQVMVPILVLMMIRMLDQAMVKILATRMISLIRMVQLVMIQVREVKATSTRMRRKEAVTQQAVTQQEVAQLEISQGLILTNLTVAREMGRKEALRVDPMMAQVRR